MTQEHSAPPSYWYGDSDDDARGTRIMQSLRAYRAAEMSMRRRTQSSMAMGENELIVLRFLTRRARGSHDVTPIELARHLDISTASITALLDRLEKSGHVQRRPHPSDRRKLLVVATPHAEQHMRLILGTMHSRMMAATRGMTEAEAGAVAAFLDRMREAVDSVSADIDDAHGPIDESGVAA